MVAELGNDPGLAIGAQASGVGQTGSPGNSGSDGFGNMTDTGGVSEYSFESPNPTKRFASQTSLDEPIAEGRASTGQSEEPLARRAGHAKDTFRIR